MADEETHLLVDMLTIAMNDQHAVASSHAWSEWHLDGFEADNSAPWSNAAAALGATFVPWDHLAAWPSLTGDSAFGACYQAQAEQVAYASALPHAWASSPQKLAVEGDGSRPLPSAWASPLRVPLPEPLALDSLPNLSGDVLPGLLDDLDDDGSVALARAASRPSRLAEVAALAPPPGIPQARPMSAAATWLSQKPADGRGAAALEGPPPGVSISEKEVDGAFCTRVEWKIEDLRGRLLASMGRPLVSPAFAAAGLPHLRLMVFPDARDVVKSARSSERKGLYASMVKKGPLHGALKLKADDLASATIVRFNLTVGHVRVGPLEYDLSEQAVSGLDDFGVDWLKHVDKANGSLCVGIELLAVSDVA